MGKLVDDMLFPARSIREEGGEHRKHHVISCSHCPAEATARAATNAGGLGNEMLQRKFSRLNWYVSRSPGGHLCPSCNPTRERAVLAIVPKAEPVPVIKEEIIVAQPTTLTTVARELSFSDRRIINSKLEETYENELVGYRDGWSDARVAKDLGVDQGWVVDLRTANFGPATGNRVVAELRAEHEQLAKQLEAFRQEGERLTQRVVALGARMAAAGLSLAA